MRLLSPAAKFFGAQWPQAAPPPLTTVFGVYLPVLERGEIDVRLERGAGLAVGVGGAVELALAVVLAADQRAHGAVMFHDDHRALLEMAGVARLGDGPL